MTVDNDSLWDCRNCCPIYDSDRELL